MPDDKPSEFSGLIPVQDALFNATTTRGFEAGQEVFGRFKLVKVLGRGGMGIVWLAHDKQLEQDVAIKVLPDLVMHDREAVTDMKRETKRSLQLNHHNIVRIYDFNQDDKGAGISMEFVDGETLSAAKADRPHSCFDTDDIRTWIEQICDALAYAHNVAKIVHRDLKPANIMLTKSGTIKVTDFGIARSISDSISRVSMRHATSGTMVYMSPQQSSGAKSSPSDDIYALGATIYDLLTGKPPFYSGNIQHQLENITPPSMTERRVELEHTGAPIPEHWEKAVAACLAKEISKRPTSIRELAGLLKLANATSLIAPTVTETAPKPAPVEKAPVAPRAPVIVPGAEPEPPPRKTIQMPQIPLPSLSRGTWKWIGIGGGSLAVVAAIAILIPVIIGKGTIEVNTDPAGATISLGTLSSASPATFKQLWSGDKVVSISLDGFEPLTVPVRVVKNQVADLGLVKLQRCTGQALIQSIPTGATCTFALIESPVAGEADDKKIQASGKTPFKTPLLPTGKYNLVLTADGFPDHTQTIEIKSNDNLAVMTDLVQENSLHLLGPDALSAVSLNQPLHDNILKDPTERSGLIEYYQTTERGYLKANEFKLAEAQLDHLTNDLGVDETSQKKQLAEDETDWLSDEKSTFEDLEGHGKFYSAGAVLDAEEADSMHPVTGPLRDELTKAKADHEQKIDKTLSDIAQLQQGGNNDEAYQLALSQLAHSGEDPRLIQELATLELAMPTTFDRVSARFKSMDDLLSFDPDLNQQSEYMRLYGIFKTNLNRHLDYQSRIAAIESTVDGYNAQIASVRAEIHHNQQKLDGYHAMGVLGFLGGIAGAAANSTPGAVAGFGTSIVGSNGANAREGDIHSLQGEVESLESQRQPSEDQLDALKKEYADFCKTLIGQVQ